LALSQVLYSAAVDEYVDRHVDELVEVVRTLVSFDTTSVDLSPDSQHTENEEAALQVHVAKELEGFGAGVDQW